MDIRQISRRLLQVGALFTLGIGLSVAAHAAQLQRIQVRPGPAIELHFDAKVDAKQLRTEFFREIIQLSLTDVGVYPSKIIPSKQGDLIKVFAYQYTPGLTRVRLSFKGDVGHYKESLQVQPNGRTVLVKLAGVSESNTRKSAAGISEVVSEKVSDKASEKSFERLAEKLAEKPTEKTVEKTAEKIAEKPIEKTVVSAEGRTSMPLTGEGRKLAAQPGKSAPSPWKGLMIVGGMGLILMAALAFIKKFKNGNSTVSTLLKRLPGKLGTHRKMIEVVANHYLAPKRSIAVVRVGGRLLVVGIAEDSINLITELESESDLDQLDQKLGNSSSGFAQFLGGAQVAQQASAPTLAEAPVVNRAQSRVRDRIRSRLEGMKSL